LRTCSPARLVAQTLPGFGFRWRFCFS
jgi:hypothetical protein